MAAKRKKGVTARSEQRDDPLWAIIDEKIGGRKGLLEAALASPNPKAAMLAELCLDKAFSTAGTKALAKKAGLEADEVVDLYRNQKWLEATMALHAQLPDIIHGAAYDARPQLVPCAECKGSGELKTEEGDVRKCWVCKGWGEIRKSGDKDKIRFIGDATGITGKVAPAVQNNIQVNSGTGVSVSFEELVRKATIQTAKVKQIEATHDVSTTEPDA